MNFWNNVGTYSGHLWCKFQQAATFVVEAFEMVLKEPNE